LFNGPMPAPILQPVPSALSFRRPIPKLEGNEITSRYPDGGNPADGVRSTASGKRSVKRWEAMTETDGKATFP